jgi:hypothetical protein
MTDLAQFGYNRALWIAAPGQWWLRAGAFPRRRRFAKSPSSSTARTVDDDDRDDDRDELGVIGDAQVEKEIEQLRRDTGSNESHMTGIGNVVSSNGSGRARMSARSAAGGHSSLCAASWSRSRTSRPKTERHEIDPERLQPDNIDELRRHIERLSAFRGSYETETSRGRHEPDPPGRVDRYGHP